MLEEASEEGGMEGEDVEEEEEEEVEDRLGRSGLGLGEDRGLTAANSG